MLQCQALGLLHPLHVRQYTRPSNSQDVQPVQLAPACNAYYLQSTFSTCVTSSRGTLCMLHSSPELRSRRALW